MNPLDKAILASLYVSELDPKTSAFHRLNSKLPILRDLYDSKIGVLVEQGFVERKDRPRLSFIGRDALKVVLVGGVFDLIHPGHIRTLKAAKEQGDVLIVVVARTSTAIKIKQDRKVYHDENLRQELVSSLYFVDLAIIGKEGTLFDTVEYVKPDVIALGYDQAHSEKDISDNCRVRNLNIRVIRLNTSIPGTKSSSIKDGLGTAFYGI